MAERREETTSGCSWIPTTPAKPGSAKEQLICKNREENQPAQANLLESQRTNEINNVTQVNLQASGDFVMESPYQNVPACCSSNSVNVNEGFNPLKGGGAAESRVYSEVLSNFDTWQAKRARSSSVYEEDLLVNGKLSLNDADQWAHMSFSDLLALADANASNEMRYGNSSIPNADTSQEGRLDGVKHKPDTVWGGISITSTPSQFEPVTPDKTRTVYQRQDSTAMQELLCTNDDHTTKEAGLSEKNEQSELVSATKPTELQENHKLDKEGTDEADLSKTPQQKPRRRKHRPKVIKENKTKGTPKPSPEKPLVPQENTRLKRKYVRRKGVNNSVNSPSEVEANETHPNTKASTDKDTPVSKRKYMRRKTVPEATKSVDQVTVENKRSSCKRSLNFDSESQIRDEGSLYCPSSNCNMESRAENCIGEDQSRTIDQSVSVKGKCKIVFSDVTNDKEVNTVQVTATTRGKNTNDSSSSSSLLTPEKQSEGMKSQHVYRTVEAEQGSKDATEAVDNSIPRRDFIFSQRTDKNGGNPVTHSPKIYKRKMTEKRFNTTPNLQDSNMNVGRRIDSFAQVFPSSKNQGSSFLQCQAANTPMGNKDDTQDGRQVFEDLMALGPRKRIRKTSAKAPTQVWDLTGILQMRKDAKKSENGKKIGERAHEEFVIANTSSPVTKKRQPNKSLPMKVQNDFNPHEFPTTSKGQPLTITWNCMSTIDSIVDQFNQLNLNAETSQVSAQNQNDFVHYQTQCAIVPYQRGGAVVPFNVSFDQVRRKKPRPKVELDDETTRVWRLLLENINSEGIDGTDEENTKWWDEERRVFNGRADSFIARMHLVQGDRRFSPWKGSVVDSVVGVFLTQNVSDQLSSSAFMSLAARFPLEAKTIPAELHEASVSTKTDEPEVCVLDSEETFGSNIKIVVEPVQDEAKLHHDIEDGDINSFDNGIPKEGLRDTSECSPVISPESGSNKLMNLDGDGRDMDEAVSSQTSVISSQNSADSLIAHTTKRIESSQQGHSEEPSASVGPNRFTSSTSFVKLLQMAGTVLHGVYENCNDKDESDGSRKVKPESSQIEYSFNCSLFASETDVCSKSASCLTPNLGTGAEHVDVTGSNSNTDISRKSEHDEVHSKNGPVNFAGEIVNGPKSKGEKMGKDKQNSVHWDGLRKEALKGTVKKERTANAMDSVDWEAVRCADVREIAEAVRERGMNNKLAERIQDFLNRIVRDHGSIDLEWLRDVPPDKAKEYLLSVRGLGLKSVECVRLLTLHQLAFPVDTNVGRIAVRLGWVPLQPLPESLQLHLLEMYPVLESIQKYLWPRLCKLDQKTLYELHYQMITFGKVFCTKSRPNCNACPMRGECRHFASAFASARLALPAPADRSIVSAAENGPGQNPTRATNTLQLPSPQSDHLAVKSGVSNSGPIIEEPKTPEPIIEMPSTPEHIPECDIEDMFYEDPDEIPTIQLNMEQFTQNLHKVMQQNTELQEGKMSNALVALTAEAASIPVPKLKNVSRLRTEHQVYELPDSHPLLQGVEQREPDDPSPYLLAIWTPGETVNSIEPPEKRCGSQESEKLCTDEACSACNSIRELNSQTVRGTLLIPCRTAMRGSFPLNGTYFQVNEVFSDHESSLTPIDVPRKWLWNLPRRIVYFGTSVPTIFKGLTTEQIQYCFWRGFVCVRGFDRNTRAPRPLITRLHFPASKLAKGKGKTAEN